MCIHHWRFILNINPVSIIIILTYISIREIIVIVFLLIIKHLRFHVVRNHVLYGTRVDGSEVVLLLFGWWNVVQLQLSRVLESVGDGRLVVLVVNAFDDLLTDLTLVLV